MIRLTLWQENQQSSLEPKWRSPLCIVSRLSTTAAFGWSGCRQVAQRPIPGSRLVCSRPTSGFPCWSECQSCTWHQRAACRKVFFGQPSDTVRPEIEPARFQPSWNRQLPDLVPGRRREGMPCIPVSENSSLQTNGTAATGGGQGRSIAVKFRGQRSRLLGTKVAAVS